MRLYNKKKGTNTGFTLVEIIVVLVILAILAAILLPNMVGFIDRAKQKKYLLNAKNCLTAAQAELTELYAKSSDDLKVNDYLITDYKKKFDGKNGDCDARDSELAKKILSTADRKGNQPYVFMIAVGGNWEKQGGKSNTSKHEKYTVLYAFYMETSDLESRCYYYDGRWTRTNPRVHNTDYYFSTYNKILSGPMKDKRVQYYVIADNTNKAHGDVLSSAWWEWLRSME